MVVTRVKARSDEMEGLSMRRGTKKGRRRKEEGEGRKEGRRKRWNNQRDVSEWSASIEWRRVE